MILTYRILTILIYPILIFFILLRKLMNKEDPIRFKEKIFFSRFNVKKNEKSKLIWFHAASIGEFKSILPIITELNNYRENLEFLITTITLTSSNLANEELQKFDNVQHRFLPLDIHFLMKNFLNVWKPSAIFLVDSEIWPNLIFTAKEKKIPLILINARLTKKTISRWKIIKPFAKKIFKSFNLILSSNQETTNFFKEFNVKKIFFTGNIKLIDKIEKDKIYNLNEKFLKNNRFWFAASTHNGEEEFCLQTHLKIKKKFKDIVTIIAPRHINRVKSIKKLSDSFNLKTQVIEKNELILDNSEIIIINSFGALISYYKYAKSVFIGKSTLKKLENVGGQNPIEAAKLGCKIYTGPFVYNFDEIYKTFENNKISKTIKSPDELANYLITDLENIEKLTSQSSELINKLSQKTLNNTMRNINNFLFNENN